MPGAHHVGMRHLTSRELPRHGLMPVALARRTASSVAETVPPARVGGAAHAGDACPEDLGELQANVPTPPDAPVIRTC